MEGGGEENEVAWIPLHMAFSDIVVKESFNLKVAAKNWR